MSQIIVEARLTEVSDHSSSQTPTLNRGLRSQFKSDSNTAQRSQISYFKPASNTAHRSQITIQARLTEVSDHSSNQTPTMHTGLRSQFKPDSQRSQITVQARL